MVAEGGETVAGGGGNGGWNHFCVLGMHMADEVDILRQLLQDALAAVSAVARNQQFSLGKPACHKANQLHGQFRSGAMIGVGQAWLFPLQPLVKPWRLRYSRKAIGRLHTLVGAQNGQQTINLSTTQSCPQLVSGLARLEISGS
jgi:hypothetical protein